MSVYLARYEAYVVAPDRHSAWEAAKKWAEKKTDQKLWLQSLSETSVDEKEVVPVTKG